MPGDSPNSANSNPHRQLPSVDLLLKACSDDIDRWGHPRVSTVARDTLARLRSALSAGESPELEISTLVEHIRQQLRAEHPRALRPVFNLTGTVLHTNLGRASLAVSALEAIMAVAAGPSNLEFDLEQGVRGDRESHVEALICELTGAEAATVVNNNAAAVLLVLNTLALGRQVPVSRGELVEIGGSFRIPEVMQRAGCELVEIGSTNRTHSRDYRNAINADTALLMKVHTSNYQVEGFTAAVATSELAAVAHKHSLPLVEDLGSGCLVDFASLGLPAEPTVRSVLAAGADIVTFSGDKLLGGPQSGLIAGSVELIAEIKSNPLKRALRLDKMTLVALAETLKLYRHPEQLLAELPTLRQLTRKVAAIEAMALQLQPLLEARLADTFKVTIASCSSQIGSGALPIETLPSMALHIVPLSRSDEALRGLATRLRQLPIPVIGRLHRNALWLDLRCLESVEDFSRQLMHLQP